MKLQDVNFRNAIATFIVAFGMYAIVFRDLSDLVIGLLSGYVLAVIQFLFGSSKGSEAKDKTISDMSKTNLVTDPPPPEEGPGGSNPPADPKDK